MMRIIRLAGVLAGLAVWGLALWLPVLRRADGWPEPQAALWLSSGLALIIAGISLQRHWQSTGLLLALVILAQACNLQLIFSPPYEIYQYFRGLPDIASGWRLACLIAVLLHGLLIAWLYRAQVRRDWQTLLQLFSGWQRLLLLMGLFYACVLVSTDGLQYGFGVFLVAWTGVFGALNLILAVRALPVVLLDRLRERGQQWFDGPHAGQLNRWLPRVVALWVLVVTGLIARVLFDGVPHIPDSVAYLFQARHYSVGLLNLPAPPDDASFHLPHFINDDGKWYSYGFPGWPAVLTLGVLASVPWLVNPLLGTITVLLTHRLVRRMYGMGMAHAVVLLLACSPWFLYSSANFMAHSIGVVLALAALLLIDGARQGGVLLRGALAGAALGLMALARPLEGILLSLVCGLRILGVGGPRPPLRIVITMALAGILVGGLIFPYDQLLTGDPLYPPHLKWSEATWYPGVDRLGFGPDIGNVGWPHHDPLPGHSPLNALLNDNKNFYVTSFELFGWSFGSLFFVLLAFLFGGWTRRDWLFWSIIFLIIAGNSLHWSPGGPDFAARYWYQAIIAFIVLTVIGARHLADRLADNGWHGRSGTRVILFITLACLSSFSTVMPWRTIGKYYDYRGMNNDIAALASREGFAEGALVFVHTRKDDDQQDYSNAFVFNPRTLDEDGTIYVRYIDKDTQARLESAFPGRPVWHVGIPPGPGQRFTVLQRP